MRVDMGEFIDEESSFVKGTVVIICVSYEGTNDRSEPIMFAEKRKPKDHTKKRSSMREKTGWEN